MRGCMGGIRGEWRCRARENEVQRGTLGSVCDISLTPSHPGTTFLQQNLKKPLLILYIQIYKKYMYVMLRRRTFQCAENWPEKE